MIEDRAIRHRERSKRSKAKRYRERRQALITLLGGKCVDCGEEDVAKLEFDHNTPRAWVARKISRYQRIGRYEREAKEGKIELRCGHCNKVKPRPVGDVSDYQCSEEPLPD